MSENNKEFQVENVFASGRIDDLIKDVKVGDNVKIVLQLNTPEDGVKVERLWFKVLEIKDDFTIRVELDSDPIYIKSLSGTDELTITRQNILEVLR